MESATHLDTMTEFAREMERCGLACPEPLIADGALHRFNAPGDRAGTRNAWYTAFDDERPTIVFGSWRTGEKFTWSSTAPRHGSPEGRRDQPLRPYRWNWRKQCNALEVISEARMVLAQDFLESLAGIDINTLSDEHFDHLMEKVSLARSWMVLGENIAEFIYELRKQMRHQTKDASR